jgi:hypothetical protein
MSKFKSIFFIVVMVMFGITTIISCEKNDNNENELIDKALKVENATIDPILIGKLHNQIFDSLAYNWAEINSSLNPREFAFTYAMSALKNISSEYALDYETEQEFISDFDLHLKEVLNSTTTSYELLKEELLISLGDEYLAFFFYDIDSIVSGSLLLNETNLALDVLDNKVHSSNISDETKTSYYIFTSVMRNSLAKYYEISNNPSHPFYNYVSSKASPATYIMADASGAWHGVGMGLPAGPVGVIVGGVLVGAMESAVAGAVSDLIDSWFD